MYIVSNFKLHLQTAVNSSIRITYMMSNLKLHLQTAVNSSIRI